MSRGISTFLANFQGGGYRPNRYEVILTFPAGIPNAIEAGNKIKFTCKAASIPGSTMGVVDVPYMGRMAKVAGDKTWDDWSVTVLLDTDFSTRGVFERWHDLILGFDTNIASSGFSNPTNYFASGQVFALDREDRVVQKYEINGAWPNNVGEVTLGYDQNDQVSEFQVTFSINGWKSDNTPN